LAALALAGCAAKIGRRCTMSADCSQNGDRLCDTTQPDGYCTIFNCEPGTCPPDESVCVGFSEASCPNLRTSMRFERTFCMATCESGDDCRAGYVCQDMGPQVVDADPPTRSVCIVAASFAPVAVSADAGVCQPGNYPIQTSPSEAGAPDAVVEGSSLDAVVDAPMPNAPDGDLDATDAADGDTDAPMPDAPDGDLDATDAADSD
jgi:hypothetical protein